ncbi:MAG: ribonuclease T [Novosphingobium sp.]|nr:ribonuclease T [Novosphingobium sp.]
MGRAIPRLSIRVGTWLALAAAAPWPTLAAAQAYQCRIPASVSAARPVVPNGAAQRTAITGYTLALSWSPEYCRGRERNPKDRLQCSGTAGRFGFIVHGLWPEGSGRSPQWCRAVPAPPPGVIRGQLCRTPAVQLLAHEWAKHGSCMARDAAGYFRVANIVADSLRYPAMETLSRDRALTAGKLREELAAANLGRPADSFGLVVNERGWLREIRVCLNRQFRPARCRAGQAGPRDAAGLKIWRGL